MKKVILFIMIFGASSLYAFSTLTINYAGPTWQSGYNDGFDEGKNLAIQGNYSLYQQYSNSYNTYPQRFPNNQENWAYFAGKYEGLYYGWVAFYNPNPPNNGGGGGGGPIEPSPGPIPPHQN